LGLDSVDQDYIDQPGTHKEKLLRVLGLKLGDHTAAKYGAGITHYLNYKNSQSIDDEHPANEMDEMTILRDGTRTSKRMLMLSEEDTKNPSRIMELMGFNPLQWELLRCKIRRSLWNVTIKNAAKEGVKHTNHSYLCEVTVKPIQDTLSGDYIQQVFSDLKPPELETIKHNRGGQMLELPIMDVHLGKLAEGYTLDMAVKLYKHTVLDLLSSVEENNIKIERIVYPIGQDFYHIDNPQNQTSNGTTVDSSAMWQEMYKAGVELLIWTVEQLRHIAPVECPYVAGNHDKMMSYCAALTVDAYYSSVDTVTVDASPSPRKYIHYGKNLIGFTHGADEKKRIETLMQLEAPEAWAQTKFREFHMGHLHSEYAKEIGGIIFRRIAAITAPDAWHNDKGFIGATRKAQAYVWDKETGKRLTIDSNVFI